MSLCLLLRENWMTAISQVAVKIGSDMTEIKPPEEGDSSKSRRKVLNSDID